MKLGKPKPLWVVVCPDGNFRPRTFTGSRDARDEARFLTCEPHVCFACSRTGAPHRVVEYRPVEEEARA